MFERGERVELLPWKYKGEPPVSFMGLLQCQFVGNDGQPTWFSPISGWDSSRGEDFPFYGAIGVVTGYAEDRNGVERVRVIVDGTKVALVSDNLLEPL